MKATRSRDTQRQKLYDWEQAFFTHASYDRTRPDYTLAECEQLIAQVFAAYALPAPRVTDGRRHRRATYYPDTHTIALPRWARTPHMVLHECAHGIIEKKQPGVAAHGPEYLRVYIDLLARYMSVSAAEVSRSAREAGLKIGPVTLRPLSGGQRRRLDAERAEVRALQSQVRALQSEIQERQARIRRLMQGEMI